MSIALLSIPLGIISIMMFIWAMNGTGAKPAKGKKKDNDSAIIGIIISVLLFFVSIGIFDIDESTGGMFSQDNSTQQPSLHESEKYSSQSQAQREVEEYNKSAVEKARSGEDKSDSESDKMAQTKEEKSSVVDRQQQNKPTEEQRQAYQKWHAQVEAKVQSIDTIWSALWTDGSSESIEKLVKVLQKEQSELVEIKVPEELTAMHRQRLTEAMEHYNQWIESHLRACQMKSSGGGNQDILTEVAKGDGLKLRANVEVSNVDSELNIR